MCAVRYTWTGSTMTFNNQHHLDLREYPRKLKKKKELDHDGRRGKDN